MNRASVLHTMNIVVHIERLVVDECLNTNLQAFEAAIVNAVSEAALHQANMRGRSQQYQGVSGEWATQFARTIQVTAGTAIAASTAKPESGMATP